MDTKQLNNRQNQKQRQKRLARLEIVAELFKKGYSVRQICQEVQVRLQLPKLPSPNLIQQDKKLLLEEWRENRLANTDEYMTLALARIDDCLIELWEAWEKARRTIRRAGKSKKPCLRKRPIKTATPQAKKAVRLLWPSSSRQTSAAVVMWPT